MVRFERLYAAGFKIAKSTASPKHVKIYKENQTGWVLFSSFETKLRVMKLTVSLEMEYLVIIGTCFCLQEFIFNKCLKWVHFCLQTNAEMCTSVS